MSEALRYKAIKLKTEAGNIITYAPHGPDFVPAADYDALHAELSALKAGQGEAIMVEAVAATKENADGELYLDWLLEGGISALEFAGTTLLVAHGQITDDTGSGEVYTAPPATGVIVPTEQQELEWLERWLLFTAEPIGQECCNRPGSECCGCPDTCYRTADDIAAAMHARHEELRVLLAQSQGAKP